MAKFIDRTGQKFNNLTIIKELGAGRVEVVCDCGTVRVSYKDSVVRGKTKHCGSSEHRVLNRVGEKFGNLTIIKELGKDKVLAQCDCGGVKEYTKSSLVKGYPKSCGCLARVGRTGQKFGHLTIIEELGKGKVLAQCDCGRTKEFFKSNLVGGGTVNCGCEKTVGGFINRVGQRFGSLLILRELEGNLVLAVCDCGSIKRYIKRTITSGQRKHCGCARVKSKKSKQFV